MSGLTDTLSGWDALEDTTAASGYIPPSDSDISASSIGGGGGPSFPFGKAIGAGASVMAGVGAYMQGQEMAGAYEYNASLALMQGQFEVEEISGKEDETLSTQKAMYAKAGVEQSGSVLDVALDTATNYEYDKLVAQYNAQSAANMDEYEAKMAKSKGEMGLAVGILGGVAKLI